MKQVPGVNCPLAGDFNYDDDDDDTSNGAPSITGGPSLSNSIDAPTAW